MRNAQIKFMGVMDRYVTDFPLKASYFVLKMDHFKLHFLQYINSIFSEIRFLHSFIKIDLTIRQYKINSSSRV